MYDDKVREFVKNIGIENIGKRLINSREGAVSPEPVAAQFWGSLWQSSMISECSHPLYEETPCSCLESVGQAC